MCGSTALTISIIGRLTVSGSPVRSPASPSIVVSISALHGQTVTQWPQETQLDSLIGAPPSHKHAGLLQAPVDRQRLIDLQILARLDAAPAEDALVGIVAVEGVGVVHRVRLGRERVFLMRDAHHRRRVVDGAVAVVVLADGAVEFVVLEEALHPLLTGDARPGGVRVDGHALPHRRRARPDELPADLDPAGVARLNRAETGVIADGGEVDPRSRSLQGRDQGLARPAADQCAIDVYRDDRLSHVHPFLIV